MNDPIAAFQEAMCAAGVFLAADAHITPDGQLHRARAADDKAGALSIWYNFHPDAPASGAAGNWRTGARLTWCGKRLQSLSHAERETLRLRIEEDKRRAQVATEARHKAAANRATWIWDNSKPASPSHPYLVRKMIKPGLSRQHNGDITLRLLNFTGETVGLQFVHADGSKRFLPGTKKKGAFTVVSGTPGNDGRIMIAEGFATASTIAELSPGAWTIAAMDAGNLEPVATECRRAFPLAEIVVCADADEIGMAKAKAAAIASRSKWIWPRFPKDAPEGLSDFNDWSCWRKSQGVAS